MEKGCSFEDCNRKYEAKGLCAMHYRQQRRGRPLTAEGAASKDRYCDFDPCGRRRTSTGLCQGHTDQQRKGEELTAEIQGRKFTAIVHGTTTGYTHHGCRCELCKERYNAKGRAVWAAKKARDFSGEEYVHGLSKTYGAGCRCLECKATHTNTMAETNYLKRRINKEVELEAQGNVCACCRYPQDRYVLDHVHGTYKFRGYLCSNCNSGIGKLGDNIEGLEKALAYLKSVE